MKARDEVVAETSASSQHLRRIMLTVEVVSNGWVVRNKWQEDDSTELEYKAVISSTEDSVTGYQNLLYEISELLNMVGSRYDEKRIHITTKKGDKYDDSKE